MASFVGNFYDKYNYVLEDASDQRVKSFFLMSSPVPLLCILGFYLYFVLKLGPRLMKNRPPFNLEKILVGYNLFQILACLYLMLPVCKRIISGYNFRCEPIDYSNDERAVFFARTIYLYFLLKIIDLLDTVFFVLRKKSNQVTFLHVYHHSFMCIITWATVKYIAGGHTVLFGVINCTVHAVMYFYYLLSAWDKEYQKNVWWKRHITHLQLVQFVIMIIYYGQVLFQPDCDYPKVVCWACVIQCTMMIILFSNFYIKAYIKPKKKPERGILSPDEEGKIKNYKKKLN